MRPTTLFAIFMVGALVFLFFIGKQTGVKAPELPDLKVPTALIEMAAPKNEAGEPIIDTGVYKWKDASGRWHYGDTPPENIKPQMVDVDPNRNVIAGTPKQDEQAAPNQADMPDMDNLPGMGGAAIRMQNMLKSMPQTQTDDH